MEEEYEEIEQEDDETDMFPRRFNKYLSTRNGRNQMVQAQATTRRRAKILRSPKKRRIRK